MVHLSVTSPWHWVQRSHQRVRGALWQATDHMLRVRTTPSLGRGPFAGMDWESFKSKPCGWLPVYRAVRSVQPGPQDTFLDIGAGHGRAALVASLFPFKRVIGLEISEPLHQLARQNLASFRVKRHAPVELVLGDAATYQVPKDVSVVFMYNPVQGDVFKSCMQQIFASIDEFPRKLSFIYIYPFEHDILMSSNRCRLIRHYSGWRPTKDWSRMLSTHIYIIEPRQKGNLKDHGDVYDA